MHLHFSNDGFDPYNPKKQEHNKGWIAAAVGAAASLASQAYNAWSQGKANKANEAFAREQFDYQKQLNQLTMERQDTAIQRAVADAREAGLSPLVAAGMPAQSGGTNSTQMSAGQVAPQVESNTFGDMMRALEQEHMQERQITNENASREDSQNHEEMMQKARLDAQNDTLKKQQAFEKTQKGLDRLNDMIKFNQQLQYLIDSKNADYMAEMSQQAMQSAKNLGVLKFQPYGDMESVKAHNDSVLAEADAKYNEVYQQALKDNAGFDDVELTEGAEQSGGVNAGVSIFGSGANGNTNFGKKQSGIGKRSAVMRATAAKLDVLNRRGFAVYVPHVGSKLGERKYTEPEKPRYDGKTKKLPFH